LEGDWLARELNLTAATASRILDEQLGTFYNPPWFFWYLKPKEASIAQAESLNGIKSSSGDQFNLKELRKYLTRKTKGSVMSVERILHPELFFGLVAPVGVNLDMIIEVLNTELSLQKYNCSTLHITEIMKDVPSNIVIKDEPYLARIKSRIAYADEICSRIEREDALAGC